MKTNFKIQFPKLPLNFRQIVRPKKIIIGSKPISKDPIPVKAATCPAANPEFPHPPAELCPVVNVNTIKPDQQVKKESEPKLFDLQNTIIEDDSCTYFNHDKNKTKKVLKPPPEPCVAKTQNIKPVLVAPLQANLDDFDKLSVSEDVLDLYSCMNQKEEATVTKEVSINDLNLKPSNGNKPLGDDFPRKQVCLSSPLKLFSTKTVGIAQQPSVRSTNITIKPWRARIIRCPGAGCTEQLYSSELLHHLNNTSTHAQWLGLLEGNRFYRQNWNIKSLENLSKTSVPFVLTLWSFDDNVFATVFEKVKGVWYNWIYVLADGDTASAYEYKLWLRGATKDIKFYGTVHSIDVSKERIRNKKDCLVLQDEQIEEFMSSNGLSSLRKCQGYDYRLPVYYSISKKYCEI